MKTFKLFLSLFLLFILFDSSIAETKYIRETVLEVAENEEPLNLKIFFRYPDPFSSLTFANNTVKKFDIDNSGNLVLWPYGPFVIYPGIDSISVFDINKKQYIEFIPVKDEIKFHYGIIGPDNKLYFYSPYSSPTKCKIIRFKKDNGGYIHDRNIEVSGIKGPNISLNISPDSCIYVNTSRYENDERLNYQKVLSYNGEYIKDTDAVTQNNEGVEIFEIFDDDIENFLFVTTNDEKIIAYIPFNPEFNFERGKVKCTFDSRIIISSPMFKNSLMRRPVMVIYDTKNDDYNIIDTKLECPRDDYEYFNVSSVNFNYIGEIYAFVVYYNRLFDLTGDEKIVLYRWRKIEE